MDEFSREHGRIDLDKASEPVVQWFKTYSDGMIAVREEVHHYLQDQTRRNIEAFVAMMSNPTKAIETQGQWMRETMDETQHLLGSMQDVLAPSAKGKAAE